MTHPSLRHLLGVGLAAAVVSAAAACAPGEEGGGGAPTETGADEVDTDISDAGDVTLTVWDQEVRGGQNRQIEALNAAFQEQYPNVTIDRTKRATEDLQRTLRTAITSDKAPDVAQVNNGRTDMGSYVENGLLPSLDGYAEAYGWTDRFPESVRALASYSEDGAVFGEGNLYGLPQVGELVGVWYNKAKLQELGLEVPRTTEEFQAALQAAKDAGELPIQFGNLDAWPGIHEFGFVQNQFVPRDDIRALGFGQEGASWTSEENVQAAQTFTDWVDAGYFTPEFNAVGYDPAWQDFARGQGVFLVAGTWLQADLTDALGDDVGFFLPPVGESGELAVTGGTGIPFSITSSENADVAAAYLDFITSEEAMQEIQETGNLPVHSGSSEAATGAAADVLDAWTTAGEEDALVPYLDYATPDFYDLLTAQVQELGNGSVDGQAFLSTLEDEYSGFVSGS
jgi:raffinose/stachyose/melibiose transport system substrate-binding protein